MVDLNGLVFDYIAVAESGDLDNAYHNLIELDSCCLAGIEQAYYEQDRADIKVLLLQVMAHFRQQHSISIFEEALQDADPDVWKAAVDGLVALGETESLLALHRSLAGLSDDPQRHNWIAEAIEQIRQSRF